MPGSMLGWIPSPHDFHLSILYLRYSDRKNAFIDLSRLIVCINSVVSISQKIRCRKAFFIRVLRPKIGTFFRHFHKFTVVSGLVNKSRIFSTDSSGFKAIGCLTDNVDCLFLFRIQQKVILSSTGFQNINCREDPFF